MDNGSFSIFFRLDPQWFADHREQSYNDTVYGMVLAEFLEADTEYVQAESDEAARAQFFSNMREQCPTVPEAAWIIDECSYVEDDPFGE